MTSLSRFRIGVVTARFNSIITSRLHEGAVALLRRRGVGFISEEFVPGSFELPMAAAWMLEKCELDGIVCLGAVVKGSTQHFDYVCSTSSSGLMTVQLNTGKPVGFGVLTCETLEQGFDRAGGKLGNKGEEAAETVLEMVSLSKSLSPGSPVESV